MPCACARLRILSQASGGRERMVAASLAATAAASSSATTMLTLGYCSPTASRCAARAAPVAVQRRGYGSGGGRGIEKGGGGKNRWRRYWGVAPESEAPEMLSVVEESDGARSRDGGEEPAKAPKIWEMDFCSRPILDERKKKVWELLVCDEEGSVIRHSQYFPNNKINSSTLKAALIELAEEYGKPQKIKFFRSQMQTIITRAIREMGGITEVPTRQCTSLINWLNSRIEDVYSKEDGFEGMEAVTASPLFQIGISNIPLEELPSNIAGEQWAFVQLPVANVRSEAAEVVRGACFGNISGLNGGLEGVEDADENTMMIPGVAVFSRRALPLSAWLNGVDICNLTVDTTASCVVLESGINQRYRYAPWRKADVATSEEASEWEKAKTRVSGLHFLAIQNDPEAEDCKGFWVLRDPPVPRL